MQWNLADLFEGIAERLPDAAVLVGPHGETTWTAYDRRADAFAAELLARGLQRGSRVGLCVGNVPGYLEALFGCLKVGAVPFNMNWRYRPAELRYLLDNADAEAVVLDPAVAPQALEVAHDLPTYVIGDTFDAIVEGRWPGRQVPPWGRSADDRFFIYTGGTTGNPKAVVWRHGDLVELLAGTATPPGDDIVTAKDDILGRLAATPLRSHTAAPLIHGTGMLSQVANLIAGGCSVFAEGTGFDPDATWRAVERHRADVLVIVGDVFARPLLDALDGHDASSLRMISSSGAMWSRPVKEALLERLPGVALLDGFGSTEAANLGRSMSSADAVDTTASFVVGERARVLAEDDTWVEPGSGIVGRVAISGPMPVEYHKDPERTAATFRTIDGVRWSIPGDHVVLEADGSLTLLGRGSSCINTGGEKVYPEEVEEVLKEHPAVLDACCLGVPDERFGEAVCALVQPVAAVDPDELKAFVKERLASYKAPRHVVVLDTLGRLPNGKLDRTRLGTLARERVGAG